MKTNRKIYKPLTLQFVLTVLICIITIKPTIQFISSISFNDDDIELNEDIDFEDEYGTELDEAIFNSKPQAFQSQILVQNKLEFDNYSSQVLIVYPDIVLPPPIIFS